MHGKLPGAPDGAMFPTAQTVSRSANGPPSIPAQMGDSLGAVPDATPAQMGSESFEDVCATILGNDAGLHLHYITGWPERTCYHYAAGDRKVSLEFMRRLIHSPQGEPFYRWFMSGCAARWWTDREHAAGVGADVIARVTRR
jgi:hypothetical protein